jgi:hypothetical protein
MSITGHSRSWKDRITHVMLMRTVEERQTTPEYNSVEKFLSEPSDTGTAFPALARIQSIRQNQGVPGFTTTAIGICCMFADIPPNPFSLTSTLISSSHESCNPSMNARYTQLPSVAAYLCRNSVTMDRLGGLVTAPMKSTTLGCRQRRMMLNSALKSSMASSRKSWSRNTFTATSDPCQSARYTLPYEPGRRGESRSAIMSQNSHSTAFLVDTISATISQTNSSSAVICFSVCCMAPLSRWLRQSCARSGEAIHGKVTGQEPMGPCTS